MDHIDHPCFSKDARHRVGRIHLPVAPRCNMQCNYCNRDFECVNESRPGVSCTVLLPGQAADYLDSVLERIRNIRVVGIAGPGDPFANGKETMETLSLVRSRHPEMTLCLATNGLEVSSYVDGLSRLGLSHVTVTVNAVDPSVGSRIYAWARRDKRMYRGEEAARVILESQTEGIARLKEKGITVKVNTVIIPGINDGHVGKVAEHVSRLGADVMNCIPLYHVAGTPFENVAPPSSGMMSRVRIEAKASMPQMSHCSRCRADAAGMLGEPHSEEITALLTRASEPHPSEQTPYVAVASMEGIFVNQHLGESAALWIFGMKDGKACLMGRRSTPPPGTGTKRWTQLADSIHDCFAVLTSGIGPHPEAALKRAGIRVVIMEGMAAEGAGALLAEKEIPRILLRTPGKCGIGLQCKGSGTGCG